MSGKYTLNKQLSTHIEELMQLQNVGWVVRKAVSSASVTLTITHDGREATFDALGDVGGIPGTPNNRRLDDTSVEENNPILGVINKRARIVGLGDVSTSDSEEHLKDAWKGLDPDAKLVLTSYESVRWMENG